MKWLNWISTVKALYKHCKSTEISELNLFVDQNIGKFYVEQCGVKVSYWSWTTRNVNP